VYRGIKVEKNNEQLNESSATLHYRQGACLSDIYVNASTILCAGRGLFASKFFHKGEVVHLSPALILPKQEVIDEGGLLLNYCISDDDSDLAIFQLTTISMANHASKPNLVMQWLDSKFNSPELFDTADIRYARLEVAYRALTDISAGDELFIDYGYNWSTSWKGHLENVDACDVNKAIDVKTETKSPELTLEPVINPRFKFRNPIRAPKGFFPSHWYSSLCTGRSCYLSCRYYFAPLQCETSRRGVYFGLTKSDGHSVVDDSALITVQEKYAKKWNLLEYVVNTSNNDTAILLGNAALLNFANSVEGLNLKGKEYKDGSYQLNAINASKISLGSELRARHRQYDAENQMQCSSPGDVPSLDYLKLKKKRKFIHKKF
jgi:hypothetical protein